MKDRTRVYTKMTFEMPVELAEALRATASSSGLSQHSLIIAAIEHVIAPYKKERTKL